MQPTQYQDIREDLKTGDIVLWSGKGLESEGIKKICGGRWSHISRLIVCQETGMVLNWESTTLSDNVDRDTGGHVKGVQVVEFSKRLASYQGDVAVRQLSALLTPMQLQLLASTRRLMKGRPYETNPLELLLSVYDGWGGRNKSDVKRLLSLFCSELVAETDIRMGVLPGSLPSNEFTPMDYSQGNLVDKMIRENPNAIQSYGDELLIMAA